MVARWGCYSGQWRPRHLVGEGHRSGQTPEGGDYLAVVLQRSIPMHQRRVPTWGAAGCGGPKSRYTAAQLYRLQPIVRWGGWCHLHRVTWPLCLPHGKLRTKWIGSHLEQGPLGALLRSDLAWSGKRCDNYSYVIFTGWRNLSRCYRRLRCGST